MLALDKQLFTLDVIHSESSRLYPQITIKDIQLFLTDKKLPKEQFTLVYVTLYFFLERFREETGIIKSPKRVFLEKSFAEKYGKI